MTYLQEAQYLSSRLDRREITREGFASEFSRLLALATGAQRTGVWVIGTTDDDPALVCLGSHDTVLGGAFHVTPGRPAGDASRVEFLRALDRDGAICANDMRIHPATVKLHATLASHGVESMLAAAFSVNGAMHGAFTCVSIGCRVEWTAHQLATLKRLVARISPALARSEDRFPQAQRFEYQPHAAGVPALLPARGF